MNSILSKFPPLSVCVKAAIKPIIGLIILEIVWYGFEQLPMLSFLAGDYLYLVKFALYAWAGYIAVKEFKFDLYGAALTGAIAGLVQMIADYILSSVFYPGYYSFAELLSEIPVWVIIAAVVAVLGALFAQRGGTSTPTPPQTPTV